MKVVSKPSFEVDEALHSRLSEKYSSFMPEFTEFTIGPAAVRVDKRITDMITPKRKQQAALDLKDLWFKLLRICFKIGIPVSYKHTALILDEETEAAVHLMFEDEKDGTPWAYIFIPPAQVALPVTHFAFILLHELCHCLLYAPFPEDPESIYGYEFFVDVLSIAALRNLVPANSKRYREAIKSISYVAADEMREKLGRALQRDILSDPQTSLRMILIKGAEAAVRPPEQRGPRVSSDKEV
jgi:hypothetical protein